MLSPLIAFVAASIFSSEFVTAENNQESILGGWKGIEMYQDLHSEDGKTFYLPNSEEIIVEKNKVRVYFYPYFKSDEFDAVITPKSIVYLVGKKKVKSEYTIQGDTLILSVNIINKLFVKMYKKANLEKDVIEELDQYGFNPSAVVLEFELDTLHKNLRTGFSDYSELSFAPLHHIQFLSDNSIRLNREEAIPFERAYQKIWYTHKEIMHEFEIYRIHGSQEISIIPKTLCQCDTIILPYMVVSWADRIRKQIKEDTW